MMNCFLTTAWHEGYKRHSETVAQSDLQVAEAVLVLVWVDVSIFSFNGTHTCTRTHI